MFCLSNLGLPYVNICSLFYFIFYFFCYKSNCFIIYHYLVYIDHWYFLQVYVYNAFSIFNCIVSVISICDFKNQYLPPPHHAVQFALPMFSFFFFFVNNVIIIYSFWTYTQDNRENLFSLLSDIYF